MREILFRGKDEYRNVWREGYIHTVGNGNVIVVGDEIDDYPVKPKTIGWYTGLIDKNGTRIFEGDILKTKYGRLCKVEWFSSPCDACWNLIPVETNHKCPDKYDLWRSKNLEVIGNIYDNPELLEAKNGWHFDI